MPIFSRVYYATRKRSTNPALDPPLGSGAYKVGRFDPGRYIEFDRVKDWWGADLPVSRGQNQFRHVRFEYYRDRDVGFEGFTADSYLFREEFTSRTWKTRYNFPAEHGRQVKTDALPDDTPSGAQGWFINTRRKKFADRRVREALNDAFDFEWTNKTIMYGSYERTISVFQNSDMMAKGPPNAAEITLFEPLRDQVAAEVFGAPYMPPVTDGTGQNREQLRHAAQLLKEAGCTIVDGKRVLPNGERLTIEFLLDEATFEPHHAALIKNLAALGVALEHPPRRSGAVSCQARRLRLRHHRRPLRLLGDAGRFAAHVLPPRPRR